jgi:hypothetical protein
MRIENKRFAVQPCRKDEERLKETPPIVHICVRALPPLLSTSLPSFALLRVPPRSLLDIKGMHELLRLADNIRRPDEPNSKEV